MDRSETEGPHVMPEPLRGKVHRRLSLIEGQIRGLCKMLENDRPCAEILVQLSSVKEAMRGVTRIVVRNHLERCATDGIMSGDPDKIEKARDEIMAMLSRHAR